MKRIRDLDYSNVPSIKVSFKIFIKSILRRFYITPSQVISDKFSTLEIKNKLFQIRVRMFGLRVDPILVNKDGIKGLYIVASYTDNDKGYLDGFIKSSLHFEKIILYHDKGAHNFKFNESIRFQKLTYIAKRHGAKWVVVGSPKTRFSDEFRNQVSKYVIRYSNTPTVLSLKERYLWGDFDHYIYTRAGGKDARIKKFFAITDQMQFDNKRIHAAQYPINYVNVIDTNASRYYLGRFNMETMKKKAEYYHSKDGKDYSYLYDVSKPIAHGEKINGIGDFERKELLK